MKIGNRFFDTKNHTYIMGILNVTPDSFSDGGKWNHMDEALKHTEAMIADGADIIDIGGESTRPGHTPVSADEEALRVLPVIEAVKKHFDIPVSVDTFKSSVAESSIQAGADLVNDIWGLKYDPKMAAVIAKYDVACTSSGASRAAGAGGVGSCYAPGCCHAFTADGRCVSLLKVLMTNCCSFDCSYCVNRKSNDVPRATFTPRELAELTIEFYRRNYIEGLFLSSAVLVNPDYTTERMLAVLRLLRGEYHFGGYIHAKAIPGTSPELLEQRAVTERLLEELGVEGTPVITVLNKCDAAPDAQNEPYKGCVRISAKTGYGLPRLLQTIAETLPPQRIRCRLCLPYAEGALLHRLEEQGQIFGREYTAEGTLLDADVEQRDWRIYETYLRTED